MALHESAEMYLETIYVLSKAGSVRSVDVAEHMGYSKPSISRAVGILRRDGYLTVDENGFLCLTDEGKDVAEKIFARHTLISGVLMAMGVDEKTAANDACKIEHVISDASFAAIKNFAEKLRKD